MFESTSRVLTVSPTSAHRGIPVNLTNMSSQESTTLLVFKAFNVLRSTLGAGNINSVWPSFYRPQHSCGKAMFLHLSVILYTGGSGRPPPGSPPPPTPRSRPQQRTVRILLECILVMTYFYRGRGERAWSPCSPGFATAASAPCHLGHSNETVYLIFIRRIHY